MTIGTQFLFRGLTLVLVAGKSYALVDTKQSPAYDLLVGRPLGIPMEFWWLVLAIGRRRGSCSTAIASARTRTWSATTATPRR